MPHELLAARLVAVIKHPIALFEEHIAKLLCVTAIRCLVENKIAVGRSDEPIAMRNRRTRTASFIASQVCGCDYRDDLDIRTAIMRVARRVSLSKVGDTKTRRRALCPE